MKLTAALLRLNKRRMFIRKWFIHSKQKIIDPKIPELLIENYGIKVTPAHDVVKDNTPLPPCILSSGPEIEFDETHPNWHDRVCYTYHEKLSLLEGLDQVLILLKTAKNEGLPSKYSPVMDQVSKEIDENKQDVDNLVKRYIMQGKIWDAWQQKLPHEIPHHPGYKRRHYGIPKSRQNNIMWEGMLRLSSLFASKYGKALNQTMLNNAYAETFFEKEDSLISSKITSNFMLCSQAPLTSITSKDEIQETVNQELPDIFPITPLIDLKPQNIYEVNNYFSFSPKVIHPNVHTIVCTLDFDPEASHLSQSQIDGNGVFNCFTCASIRAKQLYGDDVKGLLPEPIIVQGIQSTNDHVSFIVYQLNTMDINGTDGIKNSVWIDSGNVLFSGVDKYGPDQAIPLWHTLEQMSPKVFCLVYRNYSALVNKTTEETSNRCQG
ncbi:39S ribosomal protein L37, mitochondrial [Nymphon striatum]|nr:39S ribosomal protein L37, mitochondrial [Nymphon striatum]